MPALIRAAAIHPPPERGRGILAYNRLKNGLILGLPIPEWSQFPVSFRY